MKAHETPDLLVIGGGSAGHAAARTAANLGLDTLLAENADSLGGLCILRGCMPSKTLIETANRMRDIRAAARFGIRCEPPEVDIEALRARLRQLTGDFQDHRVAAMKDGTYRLVRGSARFLSPHEVEIQGCGVIKAAAVIVAIGSQPSVPDLPGLERTPYWTSDDVVTLPRLPRRIAIVGAGAVGTEFAHMFEGFGSQVTIIVRGSSILSHADPEIGQVLEAAGRERGITMLMHTEVAGVSHDGTVFQLDLDGAPSIEVDALLIATGRHPATAELGLAEIGVAMEKGRIVIDERTSTSLPHIFAAGDCASPVPVVHMAVLQGEIAARNAARMLGNNHLDAAAEWSLETAMQAWFTEPQGVQIGLAEHQARERNVPFISGRQEFADHGKGIIVGARHGFVKVLADPESGRLLGAAGTGPQVIDTAHLLQAAITTGLTATAYLEIPHYHPTLAEAWSRAVERIEQQRGGK